MAPAGRISLCIVSTLLISVLPLLLLSHRVDALVYYRVIDTIMAAPTDPVPFVSIWLDGIRLNARPVFYDPYYVANGGQAFYYETFSGDHELLVTEYFDPKIVYYNSTIRNLVDGGYYSTMVGGFEKPVTVRDDSGVNITKGFSKVRFINSWTETNNETMLLRINGEDVAVFAENQIADGNYIQLDNSLSYRFSVGPVDSPIVYFDRVNQTFDGLAYTYWLVAPVALGANYNCSALNAQDKLGRLVDGAAAPLHH